jgi:hypothetical protein
MVYCSPVSGSLFVKTYEHFKSKSAKPWNRQANAELSETDKNWLIQKGYKIQ